ncbi:uncharacterized protein EKO05_0000385 [Ascochyta rabiei]|uniref:Uncharacterized protein n=1 Tax=Didymella rabiei TaxID=5454 RepID=A0A163BQ55_DIDRA|nr:uncharacterized protein EKO05_0000385 [Ascochyta rabiei]KZM21908.1 hypothetical protein ST47_g6923 [Ascochyta rabiei]UPX09701.1 hypothetical protein EKO05_0000385 [Ascochyta rabiei]
MAPYPDTTPTETVPPEVVATAPPEDSALPGMKRGIAIGVAFSVGIIMAALLAFFVYRRRKQRAAKHTKLSAEEPVEMDAGGLWPQEKKRHVRVAPIEADAYSIHELDGSEIPELPGHYEGQELNANKKTPRASYGDDDTYGQKLKQWNDWSVALDSSHPQPAEEPLRHSNPYLEVSPSQSQQTSISPMGDTLLDAPSQNLSYNCVSPLALSPLEDAHLTPTYGRPTRQQRYYDQARTSA